jgi:hypothetical protein
LNKNDIQLVTHQENEGITDFYCHFVVRDCVLLIISHLVATPVVDASYAKHITINIANTAILHEFFFSN